MDEEENTFFDCLLFKRSYGSIKEQRRDIIKYVNSIKKEVIKEKPKTDDDVDKVVDDVLNEYNYKLDEDTINKIKDLMKKINDLDLNYSSLKSQLNSISDKLKDKVDTADMKGFFDKLCDFFSNMWEKLKGLFN